MKEFTKTFEMLARRHSWYYVFEDFLSMFINSISFDYTTEETRKNWQEKYSQEERYDFGLLIKLAILEYDKNIHTDQCWYDFLGKFYEEQSFSKKKGFSQYFTPEPVTRLMSKVINVKEGETLSEPACGSGRFMLASNRPGVFQVGMDLDITVCKMAVINLWIHGIDSVIICQNTLSMQEFKGAFIINRWLPFSGIPMVSYVDDVDEINRYVYYRTERNSILRKKRDKILNNINIIRQLISGEIDTNLSRKDIDTEGTKIQQNIKEIILEEEQIEKEIPKEEIPKDIAIKYNSGEQMSLF